jgi:hypothetical protein
MTKARPGIRLPGDVAAVLLCCLMLAGGAFIPTTGALSQDAAPQEVVAPQPAPEPIADSVRATLGQFGSFVQHPTYGEVWVPTVTPMGWHPYPPCHWVKARQWGLYYDDKTSWGQIVHHYGRWKHDAEMGWIWLPGSEFSPGWVTWRTSPQWIGWAPLPPDEDLKTMSPDEMNSGDHWIFQDASKFIAGCETRAIMPADRIPTLIQKTRFLRNITIYNGIVVFVAPTYIPGPIVDVDVTVAPWPPWFMARIIAYWNWIWKHTTVVVVVNECIR